MKKEYFAFLTINSLPDYLKDIALPYSKKLVILQRLLNVYGQHILIKALYRYKERYIDLGQLNYLFLENTLKGICKRYQDGTIE